MTRVWVNDEAELYPCVTVTEVPDAIAGYCEIPDELYAEYRAAVEALEAVERRILDAAGIVND
jgi:hypothetical protein